MITETQLSEIRSYLLSKNLPIDILLEVQDHFVSQITSLEIEKQTDFENAFEITKNIWANDLQTYFPWYILKKTNSAIRTVFERRYRKEADLQLFKIASTASAAFFIVALALSMISTYFVLEKVIYLFLNACILFCIGMLFYNLCFNNIAFKEKFKNVRFSIYHWRVMFIFSIGYFGIDYIKPLKSWLLPLYHHEINIEIIFKLLIYLVLIFWYIFTGVAQFRFARIMNAFKKKIVFV